MEISKRVALLVERLEEAMRLEGISPSKDTVTLIFPSEKAEDFYPLKYYYCPNKEFVVVVYEDLASDSKVEFNVSVYDGLPLKQMKANAGEDDDVLYCLDESNLIFDLNQYVDYARNVEGWRTLLRHAKCRIQYRKRTGYYGN